MESTESTPGWRAWRAATASLLCPLSAAGREGDVVTDSSTSLLLNPGFSQWWFIRACHSHGNVTESGTGTGNSFLRECGMYPEVQLFHGDFVTQDVVTSEVADPGPECSGN